MSDRNKGRKPGQMANKAKQGMKDQGQRAEQNMDRMAEEAKREMDRLGGGVRREAQQARSDIKDMNNEMKQKLQHH
ncbi:hypothetical protein [Nocardia sp. NPDC020380]|uniref:hypothetical protein n=1 Tax=Nocardia sp. NPDC020380 TaxID=3364309 RepID=UPI0037B37068